MEQEKKERVRKNKKLPGLIVDILMYLLLLAQMLYIFVGGTVHEFLGIAFFLCLIVHMVLKRWWFRELAGIPRKKPPKNRIFFHVVTILLILCILLLMLSSMGVSRFLFPDVLFLTSPTLHRYLATAVLTLSVIHAGLRLIKTAKKKKRAVVFTCLLSVLAMFIGLFAVPYMNRHFRKVEITRQEAISGEALEWNGSKPLVVYFTRLGNTDFEPDVDAVSGASLMLTDGELMGNDQLLAEMVREAIQCEVEAITLTGKKYPSSYVDTVSVATQEKKAQARPDIMPIDVTGYDRIILIYPLWWGTIPMPVATFLSQNDFSGKTIYLIATQGSSGYGNSVEDIRTLCPGAEIVTGTSIYCEDIPNAGEEIRNLLKEWGK